MEASNLFSLQLTRIVPFPQIIIYKEKVKIDSLENLFAASGTLLIDLLA